MLATRRKLLTLMRGSSTGGGDLPSAVTGLLARYIADDLIGTVVDAAKVTSWTDAVGDTDVAHGTAGNQPVFDEVDPFFNGHASVSFERANSHYLFASTGDVIDYFSGADKPFTAFVVRRYATKPGAATSETVFSLGNSAGATPLLQCYYQETSNALRARFGANDGTASAALFALNEIIDLGPQVDCWSSSGADAKHYLAGASQNPHYDAFANDISTTDYSAVGSMTFNRFAIGALLRSTVANHANCKIAEIVIYNRELSEAERVRVSDYLYSRYCAASSIAAFPDKLLSGLTNLWDTRSVIGSAGATTQTLPLNGSGVGVFSAASAGVAPTIRVDAATGGKYLEFDGVDNLMTCGAASDWRFLHDGSDFTLAIVYRVPSTVTAFTPIIDTLNNNVANVGFGIYHDAASDAHSIQFKIGNDTAAVINADSIDYGARPDAWHIALISHEGTLPSSEENYQLYLDNENYAGLDQAVTPIAATDPSGTLAIGGLAGGVTLGRVDIKLIATWSRKLSRPDETMLVNQILGSVLGTSHCALVGGNGFADVLSDATPHRGFPAMCQDADGLYHIIYRRAATHGSSRGVACHSTSEDGIRWSNERVIYDVDDADGRDFRGGGAFIRLTQGTHAGRLLYWTNWAADDSSLEVAGFASTNLLGISDDNGGSWTWSNPQENDPKNVYEDPWDYTVGNAASLIELSTGRILLTFTSKDAAQDTNNQDLNLSYSDDGGDTWSDSVIIGTHDVCFNNQLNKRVTESWIVEWDDATLTMFVRNDTDKEIWRAVSTVADPESWTFDAAKLFDGWGRPMFIREPGTESSGWMFHRSDPGDLSVWRYTTDAGASFDAAKAFSNLHQSTPMAAYTGTSYHYAMTDADGAVWVCYGMEKQPDSDIWVRQWSPAT